MADVVREGMLPPWRCKPSKVVLVSDARKHTRKRVVRKQELITFLPQVLQRQKETIQLITNCAYTAIGTGCIKQCPFRAV